VERLRLKGVIIGQLLIAVLGVGYLFELYSRNFLMPEFWALLIILFTFAFMASEAVAYDGVLMENVIAHRAARGLRLRGSKRAAGALRGATGALRRSCPTVRFSTRSRSQAGTSAPSSACGVAYFGFYYDRSAEAKAFCQLLGPVRARCTRSAERLARELSTR
jgi:hypothetical protein